MNAWLKILVFVFTGWMICNTNLSAQNPILDSLWRVWHYVMISDTTRLEALDKLIWDEYLYSQPDSAFYFAQLAYDFAEERGLKKFMGFALNVQGISYRLRGEYGKALEYYQRCLTIREAMGDLKRVAGSLNNIGLIYASQDQYPKALEFYKRSLKIYEDINDKPGSAGESTDLQLYLVRYSKTEYFKFKTQGNHCSATRSH